MNQPTTAPADEPVLLTEARAATAFALWEIRFRAEPSAFLTPDEVARIAVADVSTGRAIYMLALLREAAPDAAMEGEPRYTDAQRLDWLMPIVSCSESEPTEKRIQALAIALVKGSVGRAAIDRAMGIVL